MNNSLAEVHPELVFEWSEKNLPLTPDDITFGSNKKVWWKQCEKILRLWLRDLFVSGFVTDRAGKRVQTRHTFSL